MLVRIVLNCLKSPVVSLAIKVAYMDLLSVCRKAPPCVGFGQLNGHNCTILCDELCLIELTWALAQILVEVLHLIVSNWPKREHISAKFLAGPVLSDEAKLIVLRRELVGQVPCRS